METLAVNYFLVTFTAKQFMYLLSSRLFKISKFDIDNTTTLCDSISSRRHYPDVRNLRNVTAKISC